MRTARQASVPPDKRACRQSRVFARRISICILVDAPHSLVDSLGANFVSGVPAFAPGATNLSQGGSGHSSGTGNQAGRSSREVRSPG